MSDIKNITSAAAITYATANIVPVLDALATLDASTQTQNKLLAYHVFETCILAEGEKVTHAMLEAAINRPFDKRVSAKGRKVAAYVIAKKPCNGSTYTVEQFRGDKPELHVMTVYGHIAAYEKEQRETRADTKSVVEQALDAAGLPIELAQKQIDLATQGNDAAMSFVKSASEKFTPIKAEKESESETITITQEQALELALDALMDMATNGETDKAVAWLSAASELITPATVETPVQEAIAA